MKILPFAALTIFSQSAFASIFDQNLIDPDDGMFDTSQYMSQGQGGFLPVPTIITEPAVGAGLGVMGLFFHDNKKTEGTDSMQAMLPKSISLVGAMATENGTWGGALGHVSFWQEDTLRYRGFLAFGDFNLDFYSLAGRPIEQALALNLKGPAVLQQLSKRVPNSNVFIGVKQLFRNVDISLDEPLLPDSPLSDITLNDIQTQLDLDINTSGLGLVVEYDSRNNPLNPEYGFNYLAEYMIFSDSIGSDVDYQSKRIEALNYWQVSPKFNVALRVQYDGVDTDSDTNLPVYVLPSINLRGISKSRYQGSDVLVTEAEITYKFTPRWRGSIFSGIGKAANSFSDLESSSSRTTIGTGFRYLIAKRYGFAMGIDVAKGPEESAVYIQAGANW